MTMKQGGVPNFIEIFKSVEVSSNKLGAPPS